MDRRQKKTRNAIFSAFIELLDKKDYSKISVQEIIDEADVGRATFYMHFETKDFLLKELCAELFDHVFESDIGLENAHRHIFDCDAPDSVFLHLLRHLQNNDNNVLELLSCQNNDLFLSYFKENLKELVKNQLSVFKLQKPAALPLDFWINHISAVFVETIRWWIASEMKESPELITEYFLQTVQVSNLPECDNSTIDNLYNL